MAYQVLSSPTIQSFQDRIKELSSSNGLAEEDFQKALAEMHARVQAAQLSAQQAGSAYQSELNAEEPSLGPESIITSLFGDIGSAVSGNEKFSERAQLRNANDLGTLRMRRERILNALHEDYTTKMEQAMQLGRNEDALKFGQLADRTSKSLEALNKAKQAELEAKASGEIQGSKNATDIRVAEINATNRGRSNKDPDFDENDYMLPEAYRRELTKYQLAAGRQTNKNDKDAIVNAIRNLSAERISGQSAVIAYRRLKGLENPYDTEGQIFGFGKKRAKPLYETPLDIARTLAIHYTPSEVMQALAKNGVPRDEAMNIKEVLEREMPPGE